MRRRKIAAIILAFGFIFSNASCTVKNEPANDELSVTTTIDENIQTEALMEATAEATTTTISSTKTQATTVEMKTEQTTEAEFQLIITDDYSLEIIEGVYELHIYSDEFNDIDELLKYKDMESLDIGSAHLLSVFYNIDRLTELKSLKTLSLSSIIPIDSNGNESLTFINEITSLKNLYLHIVDDYDLSFLSEHKNLEVLSLNDGWGTDITSDDYDTYEFVDLSHLSNLNNLKTLYLSMIKYKTDMSFLSGMTGLEKLYLYSVRAGLSRVYLDNFNAVSALQNLEYITLDSVSFEDSNDIGYLNKCENLKTIDFEFIGAEDISWISEMKSLDVFSTFGSGYLDILPLTNVTTIKEIYIQSCSIEYDLNIADFGNLVNATQIHIDCLNSEPTASEMELLRKKLPNCEIYLIKSSIKN